MIHITSAIDKDVICSDRQLHILGIMGKCVMLFNILVKMQGNVAAPDVRDIIDYLVHVLTTNVVGM